MQTPTHTVLALSLLSVRHSPARNRAILIGSLVPDIFIYVAWIWLTLINGESQARIWNEIYFQNPMQIIGAVFNSVPIYIGIVWIGYTTRRTVFGQLMIVFGLAALIHLATDLPFHNDDAHRHFWPITNWRYISPLSYWDPDHHGYKVAVFESIVGALCVSVLLVRFRKRWIRAVLALLLLYYSACAAFALTRIL